MTPMMLLYPPHIVNPKICAILEKAANTTWSFTLGSHTASSDQLRAVVHAIREERLSVELRGGLAKDVEYCAGENALLIGSFAVMDDLLGGDAWACSSFVREAVRAGSFHMQGNGERRCAMREAAAYLAQANYLRSNGPNVDCGEILFGCNLPEERRTILHLSMEIVDLLRNGVVEAKADLATAPQSEYLVREILSCLGSEVPPGDLNFEDRPDSPSWANTKSAAKVLVTA